MPKTHDNPWNLTPKEAQAMDAMCSGGNHKLAAKACFISESSLNDRLKSARLKFDVPRGDHLLLYLKWDRYRQSLAAKQAIEKASDSARTDLATSAIARAMP